MTSTPTLTADQARALGGRDWSSPDGKHERIYINADVWAPLVGLDIEHYKSGNLRSATLRGRTIPNARALDILSHTVYVDARTGQLVVSASGRQAWVTADEIASAIVAAAQVSV